MNIFQKIFNDQLAKGILEAESKGKSIDEAKLISTVGKVTKETIPYTADLISKNLKQDMHRLFTHESLIITEFKSRLSIRWYDGLVLLQSIITISEESSMEIIDEFLENENVNEKYKLIMDVLFKLHSRSVQISKEIFTLLMNGFPDGALARWRSLHETNVIFSVLTKNFTDIDKTYDIVKRFMDYTEIERMKEIKIYKIATPKLNLEEIGYKEEKEYEKRRLEILDKYGGDFEKPNMWAKPLFPSNQKKILFYQLEKLARIDKLNPYYNQANYQVHTSPKGIYQSLSFLPDTNQETFFNYGQSNYGLSLPGQLTAISLVQITVKLLTLNSNIDKLVISEVLLRMLKDCQDAFDGIQEQIEIEEDEHSND